MSRLKQGMAIGGGVLALAVGSFFLLGNRAADLPLVGNALAEPVCPLSGLEPRNESLVERPAVAVKIENSSIAYPLSGLEDAEVVYEELVEGGITRFMAIYHCTDSDQAGPVRSARAIDPAIMTPITRILAAAGGNSIVREDLQKANVVVIDEQGAGEAMQRVPRAGLSMEHTLYADTRALRALGRKKHPEPPPDDLFSFGDLDAKTKKARSVVINFSPATTVEYRWSEHGWLRFQDEAPFVDDSGDQIAVDNVLIEEHDVALSRELVDVIGTPSIEITDVTGSGRALLFRDGKVTKGRWARESADDAVRFETRSGDEMVLHAGTTWIHLVPSDSGEVKGSFSYDR